MGEDQAVELRFQPGSAQGLFILVEFDDIKFSRADIKAVYDSICNMKGYHTEPFVGSVHDYFLEQSDGKFDLTFDVVGPVTMSKSESYYGSNSSWGNDVMPAKLDNFPSHGQIVHSGAYCASP